MMFSTLIIIINYCAINFFTGCNAIVKIQSLHIPRYVENGTEDSVILDCIYTLDPEEDDKLVVKWFLNDDPAPIYQWIPQIKSRHYSPRLKGRVNEEFSVNTDDPMTRYRALNLLRPTIDLNGKYQCHVQSLSSLEIAQDTMTIYAIPKSFEFNYTRVLHEDYFNGNGLLTKDHLGVADPKWPEYKAYKDSSVQSKLSSGSTDHHYSDYGHQQSLQQTSQFGEMSDNWTPINAKLKCEVTNVFPMPEMTLYWVSHDDRNDKQLKKMEEKVVLNPNGAYNVTITSDLRDIELINEFKSHRNNFECLLLLPDGTKNNYQRKKRITYLTTSALLNSSYSAKNNFKLISILFSILMFLGLKFS